MGVLVELFMIDVDDLVWCVDIVIEVIGGIELVCLLILVVMEYGVLVVMVNKVLLVEDGLMLYVVVDKYGVDLYFEVVVVGVILFVCLVCELFVGDCIWCVFGIVNGIINYVFD